jgi:hypothetical protein
MTGNDFKLLGKKVIIGIVIAIIPLILIAGGLWLTHTLLK